MNTFKNIIGGTEEDAYKKFPWLKDASFRSAEIDITNGYLVWMDGTWKHGTWESGVWCDGIWEDGIWKHGTWKHGTWEDGIWETGTWESGNWESGRVWSNIDQKYLEIKEWKDGKFIPL